MSLPQPKFERTSVIHSSHAVISESALDTARLLGAVYDYLKKRIRFIGIGTRSFAGNVLVVNENCTFGFFLGT